MRIKVIPLSVAPQGSNSPQIDWDPVVGASFYNVYRSPTIPGLATADVLNVISADTNTYTDPSPGTGQWYYAVTSVGPGGAESAQSSPISRFF